MTADLVAEIVSGQHPHFAMLYRPESNREAVDVLVGPARHLTRLADLSTDREQLVMIPHRQLVERGFACVDDGAPMIALDVRKHRTPPLSEILCRLPRTSMRVSGGEFDRSDIEYADAVRRIIDEEIGNGVGANFVLKRTYRARVDQLGIPDVLAVFGRLLERERGAYWTFLVHIEGTTWVGATPERHLELAAGTAVMNPISGTYRYPGQRPDLAGVIAFLADHKETDELCMVLDEELKMMAQVCPAGGRVSGPHLKEMANLAHTEYYIHGHTDQAPADLLRRTLFAPTVIGSPLESACRVVARHEPGGRGHYGGVAALIGQGADGGPTLDSAILIRTAEISPTGEIRIGVGATIVRSSSPLAEAAETRAKATGMIAALGGDDPEGLAEHPAVLRALGDRNRLMGQFWLTPEARAETGCRDQTGLPTIGLLGRRVLVVDAEDSFTVMLAQQLTSLGAHVTIRRHDEPYDTGAYELVVMGPGPGDPTDLAHPKIASLRHTLTRLLETGHPFLAICLSHQVLCGLLGLPVERLVDPHQGVQREIDYFGRPARVGFYNTFCAHSPSSRVMSGTVTVELATDPDTGEVHALRSATFAALQFHPESILTTDGPGILGETLARLLTTVGDGLSVIRHHSTPKEPST